MKKIYGIIALFTLIPTAAKAHCPLCTVGAGALAVGASYIGVSTYVVGIFLGAFALALGIWMSRIVKKEYISYQKQILTVVIFLSTLLPLIPLLQDYTSINIYWFGTYGTFFNKTYLIHKFLVGSSIGAVLMFISPAISLRVSKIKQRRLFPYQGIVITFVLLFLASLIMQFIL
ncbi:MAG: hypothetical protein CO029_02500 [Candidatus Magasanikbacteria bacterium CG_4_9_14_0_2_um_filter_41_10]|uniref:Urease accessory protein UreH-like transmembrane domain-containing protein n=1 Tax=Candidatus Magasanikbacteria bacterium CG_4_10_14_0_2_um_filter_41_31 TaxID=1974639 RepID=A0A2M7V4A2_9BACT|nr:MAG: hypothetical protein AUJ37_00285 [Candidatus Magasanikbacteria bacterium CG1_02_41_34]PIZ93378.1 MAG: hypothetical protein COX83_02180 [Candidatus Magasanikbacteria bacterium CG_4_10_14_0_2_um_filter_41_31]PJC53494.1 MAG: hypothetical protein CO029_02500 [Candidatus Magasanikbacteria bacterium CG_4_9_14_0_2_um_filter_41_10]